MSKCLVCPFKSVTEVQDFLDAEFDLVGRGPTGNITEASTYKFGTKWAIKILVDKRGLSTKCAGCLTQKAGWY